MSVGPGPKERQKQIKKLNENWAKKDQPSKVKFKYRKNWPQSVYPNRKKTEEML